MPDVPSYLLTAALSLLVAVAGFLDGQRPVPRVRLIALLFLSLLIGNCVLQARPDWEAALFPWATYAYFEGYWLWPAALYFFGLIAGQFPRGWNRRAVAAIAASVFVASLWSQRWMVTGLSGGAAVGADASHHCQQTAGDTCVPASCVALLSYWGVPATEDEMVRLCLSRHGTSIFNAYRGLRLKARDRGLRVRVLDADLGDVLRLGVPVLFGDGSHARVLVATRGVCVVHDPAQPEPEVWPLDRVARALQGPIVAIDSPLAGHRPADAPPVLVAAARHAAGAAR